MSTQTTLDKMLWMLTSKFTRNKNSNVAKIIKLFADQYDAVMKDFQRQLDWKSIDVAEGKALDNIGNNFGIFRGNMDDEKYRIRIKIGIAKNISDGTLNSIIEILSITLDIETREISIDTMWQYGKPDTIRISDIPFASLIASGMSQEELIEVVKTIVCAGINVETVELKGTFRFSNSQTSNETSPETGFYDETTGKGGYFGVIMEIK